MWPLGHVGHVTYSFKIMLFISTGIFDDKLRPQNLSVGITANAALTVLKYIDIGLYVLRATISTTILNSVNILKMSQGIIKSRKSKKYRKKTIKRTNNDLQNTTQKTKDRVTRIPLKTRGELVESKQFMLH